MLVKRVIGIAGSRGSRIALASGVAVVAVIARRRARVRTRLHLHVHHVRAHDGCPHHRRTHDGCRPPRLRRSRHRRRLPRHDSSGDDRADGAHDLHGGRTPARRSCPPRPVPVTVVTQGVYVDHDDHARSQIRAAAVHGEQHGIARAVRSRIARRRCGTRDSRPAPRCSPSRLAQPGADPEAGFGYPPSRDRGPEVVAA